MYIYVKMEHIPIVIFYTERFIWYPVYSSFRLKRLISLGSRYFSFHVRPLYSDPSSFKFFLTLGDSNDGSHSVRPIRNKFTWFLQFFFRSLRPRLTVPFKIDVKKVPSHIIQMTR